MQSAEVSILPHNTVNEYYTALENLHHYLHIRVHVSPLSDRDEKEMVCTHAKG